MKRIGLLCLVLVIALGTLGVGYATWSDNMTVEQKVYSGTIDAEFADASCDLPPDPGMATGDVWGYPGDTLTVDMDNVSSCLSGNITFTIENIGTIPVHVTKVEFIATGSGYNGTAIYGDGSFVSSTSFGNGDRIELPESTTIYFDLDNDAIADLSFHLQPGLVGQQFDPSAVDPDNTEVAGKINFHVEAGAGNDSSYELDLEFEAVRWNQT
jgi:hypothetical protein